jgi:hypothetical protein
VEFPFEGDQELAISARVVDITLHSVKNQTFTVPLGSDAPFKARIDSTWPFLYLPIETCQSIASNLSLQWDSRNEIFWMPPSTYTKLKGSDIKLDIQITPLRYLPGYGPENGSVQITLPFSALALNMSNPWLGQFGNWSYYFPMKIAKDVKQYSLGRAFLQESYLITNYDRSSFVIKQVNWEKIKHNRVPDLVEISSGANQTPEYMCPSSRLSPKAVIGIGVGAGLFGIIILIVLAMIISKARTKRRSQISKDSVTVSTVSPIGGTETNTPELSTSQISEGATSMQEANGSEIYPLQLSDTRIHEMSDTSIALNPPFELDGSSNLVELGAVGSMRKPSQPPPFESQPQTLNHTQPLDSLASPIPQTPLEYYGYNFTNLRR